MKFGRRWSSGTGEEIWTIKGKTYVVPDGGTNASSNPNAYTIEDGFTLASPSKTGHKFEGWYSDGAYTSKVESVPVGSTGNRIFYAKFTADYYTVIFDSCGGSAVSSVKKAYGETVTDFATPERKGYTFLGWYTAKSGGEKITSCTISVGDITLYAHWEIITYTITLWTYSYGTTTQTYTIETETFALRSFGVSSQGYLFRGWYNSDDGVYYTQIEKGTMGDMFLSARWYTGDIYD